MKHKSINPAHDHHLTTNEFLQMQENFMHGVQKHLILPDKSAKDAASAHDCADIFANFFSLIVKCPDWTKMGLIIDLISLILTLPGLHTVMMDIISEHIFNKFKIRNLTPYT